MLSTNYKWICTAFIFVIAVFPTTLGDIKVVPEEIFVKVKEEGQFTIQTDNFTKSNVTLTFVAQHSDLIRINPSKIRLKLESKIYVIKIEGLDAGHSMIFTTSSDPEIKVDKLYVLANIYYSKAVDIITTFCNSFYIFFSINSYIFQVVMNFKRKSVIGLSFDYLGFSMVEYISFGIFIQTLYFSSAIQDEYFEKTSRGFIEVNWPDIFVNFGIFFTVSLTISQCFIYERGTQVISIIGRIILALLGCFYIIVFILGATGVIEWLDFIHYCLYLTIVIRILKYIPQVYMNYVRKSTVGWSIYLVLSNSIIGICSLFFILCNSYNYNDWLSILYNPRKLGLGLFSILFQILFIIQHYVLYKNKKNLEI